MRREAVIAAVPGHEGDPAAAELADDQGIAGRAVRGLDADLVGIFEELIEPRPADDTNAGELGHGAQATFEPEELEAPDELLEPDDELVLDELLSPELPELPESDLLAEDDPEESLDELLDDSLDELVFSLSLLPPLAVTEPLRLSVR